MCNGQIETDGERGESSTGGHSSISLGVGAIPCVCGVQNANVNWAKMRNMLKGKALKYEQLNRVYVYGIEIGVMGRTVRRGIGGTVAGITVAWRTWSRDRREARREPRRWHRRALQGTAAGSTRATAGKRPPRLQDSSWS